MHARRRLGLLACAALALAGCSNGSSPINARPHTGTATASAVGGVQKVTVEVGADDRFHPSTIVVHPGKVEIVLKHDAAGAPHNLSIGAPAERFRADDRRRADPVEQLHRAVAGELSVRVHDPRQARDDRDAGGQAVNLLDGIIIVAALGVRIHRLPQRCRRRRAVAGRVLRRRDPRRADSPSRSARTWRTAARRCRSRSCACCSSRCSGSCSARGWASGSSNASSATSDGTWTPGVGAVLGVLSVLLVSWMIAVPLASSPYPALASEASRVVDRARRERRDARRHARALRQAAQLPRPERLPAGVRRSAVDDDRQRPGAARR